MGPEGDGGRFDDVINVRARLLALVRGISVEEARPIAVARLREEMAAAKRAAETGNAGNSGAGTPDD